MPKQNTFEYPIEVGELDDAKFGSLCRALGKTAALYREQERGQREPEAKLRKAVELGLLALHQVPKVSWADRESFYDDMKAIDAHIGSIITGVIRKANYKTGGFSMTHNKAVFRPVSGKSGVQPVLYTEYWHTDDLDQLDRNQTEIQVFIGLNNYLDTPAGKRLAQETLAIMLEDGWDSKVISPREIPTARQTFGTVLPELFEPFVKA